MDDLDPANAACLDDLAACLRHVHLLADRPTYRALEQESAKQSGVLPGTRLRRVRLTRSIVSEMLLGQKFPGKAFLLTFVDACGIDLAADTRWAQAWDRLAGQYQRPPALEETERLRQENQELRLLIETQQRAHAELEQLRDAAEHRADTEQARAQVAESRLGMAIMRAETAESFLEWERNWSGRAFVSVLMPRLGNSTTGEIVTGWLKRKGDQVNAGEALIEISADDHGTLLAPATGILLARADSITGKAVMPGTVLAILDQTRTQTRTPVTMPQLGKDVTEGTVTRWLKHEGELVRVDEPLLEVSTDKVDTEIPSPSSGIVRNIAVDDDETVAVGTVMCEIEGADFRP